MNLFPPVLSNSTYYVILHIFPKFHDHQNLADPFPTVPTEEAHPNTQWLYTGHSLGALLAELVAAQRLGAPALTFSAPPLTPLLKRLKQPELRHWGTVTLYDTWIHLAHVRFVLKFV
jgi:hypothetical protein